MSINLRPSRYPSRATGDQAVIRQVLDDGLFCTVAFLREGIPHQIPTGYCHDARYLYIHAGAKSAFIDTIIGQMVSFSVTHMDGVVLSHSAFDSSFNYRSVIGFSIAEEMTDPQQKLEFFKRFTDRYVPGRIADVGDPTLEQVGITRLVRFSLENAAVKMRSGDVNVSHLETFGKWCGVIPIKQTFDQPIPDAQIKGKVELPGYIRQLIAKN